MTGKEIAQLIESPELCSQEDFAVIEKLAEKYPYAQSFPLLLLQYLGKTNSIDFEDQLSKHAFKISDRKHLYFLINEGKEFAPTPIVESPIEEPVLSVVPEVEVDDDIDKNFDLDVDEEIVTEKVEETEVESITEATEEVYVREEVDINPNEDMKDFTVLEVEEMNFEPVTIDFDEEDLEELDLDEPITDVDLDIDAVVEEDNELEETVAELTYDFDDAEVTEIETEIEDTDDQGTDVNRQTEKVEEITQEVEETEDNLEIETHESEEYSKHDQHLENKPIEESVEEDSTEEVDEHEVKPLAAFDPTVDLINPAVDAEDEKVSPSTFDEKSKAISLDIISEEKESEPETIEDELEKEIQPDPIEQVVDVEEEIEPVKESEEVTEEYENQLAEEKRSFLDWLKVSATTHSEEYQVKQQRTVEIVEKFIKDQPKITRISKTEEPEKKAAEFFKVSTIARESLNEEAMPVSETLAQIYINQGNFGKAIDAYNQLLLFYPEKKSFFADQIKKLKKKIKS